MPFGVPQGWVWTTVNDISSSILYGVSESAKANGAYKLLRITDIQENQVNWNTVPFTDYDEAKANAYLLQNGDIVFARTGATVGKSYLVKDLVQKAIYASYLIRVQIFNTVLPQYVKLFFESNYYWEQIELNSVGIGQPNVNGTILGNLKIPIPPIKEQQRIVAEIKKWLTLIDIIETGKTDLQNAIKQAKSKILDLAIHGKLVPQNPNDEPASEQLKRINPEAKITCDNAHSRKLPINWISCKLSDICIFLSRGKSPEYSDVKKYPVFAQKCNLKDGSISIEKARFLNPDTLNKWQDIYQLQEDDIVINSTGTGTVGRVGLFKLSCLGSFSLIVPDSHISVVRTFKEINSMYIYTFLKTRACQTYFEDNLSGSTNQKELYISVIADTGISLPPVEEQKRIVAKVEELFNYLDHIERELQA